ncbi:V-type ATP synthase subunit F [Bienertia sinuspersici]
MSGYDAFNMLSDANVWDIGIAEALAGRHSLKIATEAGFRKVILETDCYKLCSQLKKNCMESSDVGNIVVYQKDANLLPFRMSKGKAMQ